jgi:hypothetical protein
MAVIVPGPIIADIRGKCGGVTYSRNQGGLYVKANPDWVQPESAYRDATQQAIRDLTPLWSTQLTETQRQGWRVYAKKNPRPNRWGSRTLHNGYAFWVRANIYAWIDTEDVSFPNAPSIPPTGPPTWTATANIGTNKYTLTFPTQTYPTSQTDLWIYIYDQSPTPSGQTGTRGPWRRITRDLIHKTSLPKTISITPCWPLAATQHRAIKIIALWNPSGAFASTSWTQIDT